MVSNWKSSSSSIASTAQCAHLHAHLQKKKIHVMRRYRQRERDRQSRIMCVCVGYVCVQSKQNLKSEISLRRTASACCAFQASDMSTVVNAPGHVLLAHTFRQLATSAVIVWS